MDHTKNHSEKLPEKSATDSMRSLARKRARILIGCYRKGEFNDAEIYFAALVATLSRYPPQTIIAVTDPETGLPIKIKWIPTLAEVNEACKAETKYSFPRSRTAIPPPVDRSKRETGEELRARHPPNWGLSGISPADTSNPPFQPGELTKDDLPISDELARMVRGAAS